MSRLFWRFAYPFVIVAHRMCGASYKWVNVGKSAWMRPEDGYGALWHYEWFGTPIDTMPSLAVLCGIRYRVTVAEGLVLFRCDDGMSSTQFCFERDPHSVHSFLWYCEVEGRFPAGHWEKACRWVQAVYGGSFTVKARPISTMAKEVGSE